MNARLMREADVTGDGRLETITLLLKAANPHAPMQWLLTIDSGGQTIFDHDSDDESIDALFDDRAALPGCADYLSCKERYYFQSILENLIDTDWTPEEFLEMRLGGRLPPGVAASVGLTGPAAAKAVADLEARLREKRAVVVVVPLSPVENRPRMAWLPQAGQFVEIE